MVMTGPLVLPPRVKQGAKLDSEDEKPYVPPEPMALLSEPFEPEVPELEPLPALEGGPTESVVGIDAWDISAVTDRVWLDAQHTSIECYVTFPNHIGGLTEPLLYRAVANDTEPHGKQLFLNLVKGKWGPIAPYTPNVDTLAAAARSQRDMLLRATDWTHLSDIDQAVTEKYAPYRQALRDITQQSGFPLDITWPVKPD